MYAVQNHIYCIKVCFLHDVEQQLWNEAREPGSGMEPGTQAVEGSLGTKLGNGAREHAWLHVVVK